MTTRHVAAWTVEQMPDQTGRPAVVTGASSGLEKLTAQELARKGAESEELTGVTFPLPVPTA